MVFKNALIVSWLFLTCSVFASPDAAIKIKQILAPYGKKISASVRTMDGQEIVAIHSDQDFTPASVAKLISTGCSLRELSPQYQFETWFGIRGSIAGPRLIGDLVIQGSGDPSFVIENLKEALERLRVLYGISEIQGNLIFDSSYLGVPSLQISDDFEGDEVRAFNAPITANPLNFNSFSIAIASLDGKVFAQTLPKDSTDIVLKSAVKSGRSTNIEIDQSKPGIAIARGEMAMGAEPKFFYRALQDPYSSYAQLVIRLWSELGGLWVTPKFKIEMRPVTYQRLFASRSAPLAKILMDINKLSTNMGAEMTALAAGASAFGHPASFEKSKKMMLKCWQEMGLPINRFKLENASGLSRETKLQTRDLTAFLLKLRDFFLWPEYLSSLSVLGRDGTTRKRLADFAGQGRLKTGRIQGVRTIAGYLFPKKGNPLILALFSENLDPKVDWQGIEDQIIQTLLEN